MDADFAYYLLLIGTSQLIFSGILFCSNLSNLLSSLEPIAPQIPSCRQWPQSMLHMDCDYFFLIATVFQSMVLRNGLLYRSIQQGLEI